MDRTQHGGRRQQLSLDQALQKARHFCAYQERCHSETKEKLYGFGLRRQEVEEALSRLIEENYLNEERFAIQFAGGRFRMKHWGRVKIRYELKQRQVGEYCIKKALASIPSEDYDQSLLRLAADKWADLDKEEPYIRRQKLQSYLVQKGYEMDRIQDAVTELKEKG